MDDQEKNAVIDSRIGSVVENRFRIEKLIGQGGMGSVYKARNIVLDKPVAIKFLQARNNQRTIMRFQQEAKAMSVLSHPNVISFYDFGTTTDGDFYMATDFIEGETLSERLAISGPLTIAQAVSVFTQVCDGLIHAHDKNIIHRDIKPSNIMLIEGENGISAKLFDFGIAKVMAEDEEHNQLTQTGEVFGSPLYMSPEQCRGMRVDTRSDIYSLACVLYEMICGKPPFRGAHAIETITMHLSEMPIMPSRLNPSFPAQLDGIIARGLAKSPSERYLSVGDFKFDVLAYLRPEANLPTKRADETKTEIAKLKRPAEKRSVRLMRAATIISVVSVPSAFFCFFVAAVMHNFVFLPLIGAAILILGIICTSAPISDTHSKSLIEKLWPDPPEHNPFVPNHLLPVNRTLAENLKDVGSEKNALRLGFSSDVKANLYLSEVMREHNPHVLYLGASGTKSLLRTALYNDIHDATWSVAVIDSGGGLVKLAIEYWGGALSEQACVVSGDQEVRFNPLLLAGLSTSDKIDCIVAAFKATYRIRNGGIDWNEQSSQLLQGALAVLIAKSNPLTDLPQILSDRTAREEAISIALDAGSALDMQSKSFVQNLARLNSASDFEKFCSPVLDAAFPAIDNAWLRANFSATENLVDIFEILRSKKALLMHTPCDEEYNAGAGLLGILAVQMLFKCKTLLYQSQNIANPMQIYCDNISHFFDAHTYGQITSRHNRHLQLAVLAACPRLSRLPLNLRDLLISRPGLLGCLDLDRQDASTVARFMLPPESIYLSSGKQTTVSINEMIEALTEQPAHHYVAWIREATAGIFLLEKP